MVHADFAGNVLSTRRHVAGDPVGAFAAADRVIHLRLRHNRVAPVALEPRGLLADFDALEARVNLWMSTQAPFLARADLARALHVAEERLRVIVPGRWRRLRRHSCSNSVV